MSPDELELEREKFAFEKAIREDELKVRQREVQVREDELADARRKDASEKDKKNKEDAFGARLGRAFIAVAPIATALLASAFGFLQAGQSLVKSAQYNAATEQYRALLDPDKIRAKRVDEALDVINGNVKAIHALLGNDVPFTKHGTPENKQFNDLRNTFYQNESSVTPITRNADLTAKLAMYEDGIEYATEQASGNSSLDSAYKKVNDQWVSFQEGPKIRALSHDYPQLISDLTSCVGNAIAVAYLKNSSQTDVRPVGKVFNDVINNDSGSR